MPHAPSIKKQLLLGLSGFVLLLLPLWAWILWNSWQQALSETGGQLQTRAKAVSEQVESLYRSEGVVLDSVLYETSLNGDSSLQPERVWYDSFARHLKRYNSPWDDAPLHAMFYLDASGHTVATSVAYPNKPVDVSDRPYFVYHRDHPVGASYLSAVTVSRVTGYWVVYLTQRVDGPQGEFRGVVGMSIRTEVFDRLFESSDVAPDVYLNIYRTDGAPIFRHPFTPQFATSDAHALPRFQEIVAARDGYGEGISPIDQRDKVVGFATGRQFPILTLLAGDKEAAFRLWQGTALQLTLVGLALLALLLALFVFVLRQVDELKSALEATAKASAASEAKSAFLANMSHEIRTPMNAVLGFAQLLSQDSHLSDDGHKKVDVILRSGNHLLTIINDILELARIESGHMVVKPAPLDLGQLIDDLTAMFQHRAAETRLAFKVEKNPGLPAFVVSDAAKLRKILINLLGNAFKYTKQGSVRWRIGGEGATLEFLIEDTGIGLARDEIDAVFEPFQRTPEGERTAAGSGLGLSISRDTARLLGGDITVESRRGAGSTFRFTVEAPAAASLSSEKPVLRRPRLAPENEAVLVLVVDDLEDNRTLMVELLRPMGFQIAQAATGDEAVEICRTRSPRVVLLDRRMPGMDGLAAAHALKKLRPDLVVLGVSATAFAEDQSAFVSMGLDGFLSKPFLVQDLVDLLARAGLKFIDAQEPVPGQSEETPPLPDDAPWLAGFRLSLAKGSITELKKAASLMRGRDETLGRWLEVRLSAYDLKGLDLWAGK